MKPEVPADLLQTLKTRFDKHMHRHEGVAWSEVEAKLGANPGARASLAQMEETSGEPDVISFDMASGRIAFCDCSPETPTGRRSICYDRAALTRARKNKLRSNAMEVAAEMGIELLTEEQYRALQALGVFDRKTSR